MNKHIPKNKYAEKRGFTIVETLVAITILMIAIAGPLVVASKSLFSSNLSKNQMVASYLAQESMEVVKNIRDNNLYLGQNWLQNGAGSLSSCTKSNPCDASAIDGSGQGGQYSSIVTCAGGPCQIYIETNGYGHTVTSQKSFFTRNFYLHAADSTDACVSLDECGITVEVYWNQVSVPYSVVMTSEITSTLR